MHILQSKILEFFSLKYCTFCINIHQYKNLNVFITRAGSLNRFKGALNRGDSEVNRRRADGAPQLLL